MTAPPKKHAKAVCSFAPCSAASQAQAAYKGQLNGTTNLSNTPFLVSPSLALTSMENSPYQSRWRSIDSPDQDLREIAIRPYLTKFSSDPSIPPLPPVIIQVPDSPPPHFPAFPTNNLDPAYKPRPEDAFQIVWDTNYNKDDPSYKPRPEDAFQLVWDSNYRKEPTLLDPSQGDTTSHKNSQRSIVREARRTTHIEPGWNVSISRGRPGSPAACRHLEATRKQSSEYEPVNGVVHTPTRNLCILKVEDDNAVSSNGQKTFTPGRTGSFCGDLAAPCPELDSESDLRTRNVRPRRSFFEVVLNPTEE
jgi:hypothetical protein